VTTSDLTWSEAFRFYRWKLKQHYRPGDRPRASWAQILSALGIRDTRDISYKWIDADCIPSNIDIPIQRVSLYHLGIIALVMGSTCVTIDTSERLFRATGPYAAIITEEVPGFGKLIRFDGDYTEIRGAITMCSPSWVIQAGALINGKILIGPYLANGVVVPLHVLTAALTSDWDDDQFDREIAGAITAPRENEFEIGLVLKEAVKIRVLLEETALVCLTKSVSISLPHIARWGPVTDIPADRRR
jgi:hypothetical protein